VSGGGSPSQRPETSPRGVATALAESPDIGEPQRHPAPKSLRETFELFALYRRETGLEGLFEGVDLASVTPRQIYYAVYGQAPERIEYVIPQPGVSPLQRFVAALSSSEFRSNIVRHLLDAFPERKRLLFLHIPRAAGSELSVRLMSRYPSVSSQLSWPGWLSQQEFCLAIRQFVCEVRTTDSIFVRGHNTLEQYRAWRAIRFQDSLFAVLREPVAMTVSQVNYVLTRMFSDATPPRPDTVAWRSRFGLGDPAVPGSRAEILTLARRVLRDQGVVASNTICRYLGDGSANRAVENIVLDAIELTDFQHYDDWCRRRWGIDRRSRSNASASYLALADFTAEDRDYIAAITAEDAKVYAVVQQALARRGGLSITGGELLQA
jgi:hypothetical protein